MENIRVKGTEKLPRQYIPRIVSAVSQLSANPYPQGTKKLVGSEHTYRIRVGDYRIVYEIQEDKLVIQVVRVCRRKDVYK